MGTTLTTPFCALFGVDVPIVLDPVSVSKHGDPLLHVSAVAALRDRLMPLATVITPNLPEAELLADVQTGSVEPVELARAEVGRFKRR